MKILKTISEGISAWKHIEINRKNENNVRTALASGDIDNEMCICTNVDSVL